MRKGTFIVLYGVNSTGKSTQKNLLTKRLQNSGHAVTSLKYPLYDIEPSGPMINEYLRRDNPLKLTPREFQIIQVVNRTQYDNELRRLLAEGTHIVAEDYTGTGIAWGMAAGIDKRFLVRLNTHLLREDIGILFNGKQFIDGKEDEHTHEEDDDLIVRSYSAHRELASDSDWYIIASDKAPNVVHAEVWRIVESKLNT